MSEDFKMNIDEIEKYIIGKKVKDMSLEEIRNFIEAQGNTIILNHHIYEKNQKEIERLQKDLTYYQEYSADLLNKNNTFENIIKEVREYIESELWNYFEERNIYLKVRDSFLEILDKGGK